MSLSVVITSFNRPTTLRRAVSSACAQQSVSQIIVVDDNSDMPPVQDDFDDARVLVLPQSENGGVCCSRNIGLAHVANEYVVFLDDDDQLPEDAFEPLLVLLGQAQQDAEFPCVLVGSLLVERRGKIVARRLPPCSLPGQIWGLDESLLESGKYSFNCKQAALFPTELLRQVGGWNEDLRSRSHTELFFRLCEVARIIGVEHPSYILSRDPGLRLTGDLQLREESYRYLLATYTHLMETAARLGYFRRTHRVIQSQSSVLGKPLHRARILLRDAVYRFLH